MRFGLRAGAGERLRPRRPAPADRKHAVEAHVVPERAPRTVPDPARVAVPVCWLRERGSSPARGQLCLPRTPFRPGHGLAVRLAPAGRPALNRSPVSRPWRGSWEPGLHCEAPSRGLLRNPASSRGTMSPVSRRRGRNHKPVGTSMKLHGGHATGFAYAEELVDDAPVSVRSPGCWTVGSSSQGSGYSPPKGWRGPDSPTLARLWSPRHDPRMQSPASCCRLPGAFRLCSSSQPSTETSTLLEKRNAVEAHALAYEYLDERREHLPPPTARLASALSSTRPRQSGRRRGGQPQPCASGPKRHDRRTDCTYFASGDERDARGRGCQLSPHAPTPVYHQHARWSENARRRASSGRPRRRDTRSLRASVPTVSPRR